MSAQGPIRAAAKEVSRADWRTPPDLFTWLDGLFHFYLDAAASRENSLANSYIDEESDALSGPWADTGEGRFWGRDCGELECEHRHMPRRAFVNPPYGNLQQWVEKFAEEARDGWLVVALLPANTDTRWFCHCWQTAAEIWFLTPRVNFVDNEGKVIKGNTGGSMIVVWRSDAYSVGAPVVRHINWRSQVAAGEAS